MSRLPPRADFTKTADAAEPVAEFYFLGLVRWQEVLALQQTLVAEAVRQAEPRIRVLLCEHPEIITVGRTGSRSHIRFSDEQLRRERLHVQWIGRGGGCILHAPGQLCVYPILSLEDCHWSAGEYLRRFRTGIRAALGELGIHTQASDQAWGIWGRSGLLAALGVAVRDWVTWHGAFINVNPSMSRFAAIDSVSPQQVHGGEKTTMSSLFSERRLAVRMTSVRAALVTRLAASFSCERYYLHTGHPMLHSSLSNSHDSIARAG